MTRNSRILADALHAEGIAAIVRGDRATALARWIEALGIDPAHADAAVNATLAALQLGRWAEAEALAAAAIARGHPDPRLRLWRGHARVGEGRAAAAADAYREALDADPGQPEAWYALGLVLRDLDRREAARAAFGRVLELVPDHAEAAFEAAQLDLAAGRWAQGFALWQARLRRSQPLLPERLEGDPWDGAPAPGATLLLQAEQGVGDTLQFLRYAGLAAARVGRVVVRAHAPLAPLLGRPGLPWRAARFGETVAADLHAPLLDLPRLLGCADPCADRAAWLAAEPPVRRGNVVALVWAGNPEHHNDARRSAGFDAVLPLRAVPGVEFRHFQFGAGAETAAWPELIDATAGISDFDRSAAALAACDLVIAVDTAIVHLAGALGLPAWVLTPAVADWRWGAEGTASPWYPLARVFRQSVAGDWSGPVAAVAAALAAWRKQSAMESARQGE
ncbi:hypothetical protein KL86APRO_10736 [uncultured Alphaproteobacteria bacterium]|uniref:Uncharacterized protein n=1 Tax=uncultured Alphaproteobacteria bacterium TaxID=91750 RepID=A0A212J9X4_9PROT|nr:hypothetical protein KL86APRO_10736 [uncultured Alphaproteobacteria bacterium]